MRERLKAEIAAALKARNRPRLAALRLISAALQERDLAGKGALEEADVAALLRRLIRQRREAHAIYLKAGRVEQAEQEAREITVIEEFLPQQLSEAELKERIALVIAELGATGPREIGKVMAHLKERYQGRIDFARASSLVKERLS
jgi:uncharacterized protein YqeY